MADVRLESVLKDDKTMRHIRVMKYDHLMGARVLTSATASLVVFVQFRELLRFKLGELGGRITISPFDILAEGSTT